MEDKSTSSCSSPLEHNSALNAEMDRLSRIKKSKNIRKDKVLERRANAQTLNNSNKINEKDSKKELQKEKNRVAAQLSRDRQKKYV